MSGTSKLRSGARMPRQVDYYFSLQSPWAYIGHKLFREVANTYGLKVNHKPVVLIDLFAETGGLPLAKRHPVRQRYRLIELQRWREKRGLSFSLRPKHWPFDPKRLVQLADACGLPGKRLLDRANSPEIAEAYERNREDAIAVGVFGSPGF